MFRVQWMVTVGAGMGIAGDVIVTGVLISVLKSSRTGVKKSVSVGCLRLRRRTLIALSISRLDTVVDTLMVYSINTGVWAFFASIAV